MTAISTAWRVTLYRAAAAGEPVAGFLLEHPAKSREE
jgi:hypothetical protein